MAQVVPQWTDEDGARRAETLFDQQFHERPDGVWAAPGRVNLIGEHLDYNGGAVLPMALPHSTFVALRRRTDRRVRIASTEGDPAVWEGELGDVHPGSSAPAWVRYAVGPAWVLGQDADLAGFDAAITSCVPLGAGLSSSAAIECSVALALNDVFALGWTPEQLVAACVRAENEVVGAPTGGMDQAASVLGSHGHALHLDCATNESEQVPFDLEPAGLELLVIDTQAHHSLVDGQYGARRAACEAVAQREGVALLSELPDPQAALERTSDAVERRRLRHVITEIPRVAEFTELLRQERYDDLGPLMAASHESLRDDYEVSCAELDAAVEAATAAGALGARMTGGGFGGSAIALVRRRDAEAVQAAVEAAYAERGWTPPRFLRATAGEAARRIS